MLADASLSARQRQISDLAAEGRTDKEIGRLLGLSESTLRTYWERLRLRLEAKSRTEAVARLLAERLDRIRGERDALLRMLKLLPQFVWTADPDGHIDFYNDWFLIRGGLCPQDCLGQGCRALMLPEDLPASADGGLVWHQVRLFPLHTETGSVYKWVGTAFEVVGDALPLPLWGEGAREA